MAVLRSARPLTRRDQDHAYLSPGKDKSGTMHAIGTLLPSSGTPREAAVASGMGGPVVVAFQGELTIKEAPTLRDRLLAAIRAGAEVVVADLAEVSFVDQSAMGVIVGARTRLVANGGQLRLAAVQPKVVRVIGLMGLEGDLPVYPTVEAALADPAAS